MSSQRSAEEIAKEVTDQPTAQAEIAAAVNRWREESEYVSDDDALGSAAAFLEGWHAGTTRAALHVGRPGAETVEEAYERLGPKLAEAVLYLEDWASWWRLEQESVNLYRVIAAEFPIEDHLRTGQRVSNCMVQEAESLDALLDQVLEGGVPWEAPG